MPEVIIYNAANFLGLKANYKESAFIDKSLCFIPNFGTSNAIFSCDDNSSYQNYVWIPIKQTKKRKKKQKKQQVSHSGFI